MAGEVFDDLTDVYEAMIDWPKRLANEGPFYRRLFERTGGPARLDVACGTGQHAAMFHAWGLRVEGADLSPQMIDRAAAGFGQPEGLRWVVRGFDQPIGRGGPFDAAMCVGNSLALAPDAATAGRAIARDARGGARRRGRRRPSAQSLATGRRPLPLAEVPAGRAAAGRRADPQGRAPLRPAGLRRAGGRQSGRRPARVCSNPCPSWVWRRPSWRPMARQAGAARVSFFGGYHEHPYQPDKSVDLVMVAEK